MRALSIVSAWNSFVSETPAAIQLSISNRPLRPGGLV
jgi:hypothetical protein